MIEQSILPCKRPKVERAKLSQNAICMLYAVAAKAPPGLLWVGHLYRGDAPACIPPPLRGYCGGCLYRGDAPACILSPLRGYCGGHLYRGAAPACILSPLRGFCVHHNRPRSTLSIARQGIVYTIAIERKPQNYILPSLTGRGWGRVCCGGVSAVGECLLWGRVCCGGVSFFISPTAHRGRPGAS